MASNRVLSLAQRLPVTILLTLAVTAVFAIEQWMGGPGPVVLQRMGAMNAERIVVYGEGWRLISVMFLHAHWLHFVLNTFALVQLAALVEILFGSHRLIAFYLVCGLVASLASALFNPVWLVGGVGASGALFGMVGLIMGVAIYGPEHWREPLQRPLRALAFTVGIGIAMFVAEVLLGTNVVDHWAHFAGFVTGLLLAAAYPEPSARVSAPERILAYGSLGVMLGAGISAAAFGPRSLETLPDQWVRSTMAHVEATEGPFAQSMALMRALDGYRVLDIPDREVHAKAVIAKLSPESMVWAAGAVYALEEHDEELRWLAERWVEIAPAESNPRNVLAWSLVTDGAEARRDPARALVEIDRGLALLPDDASVTDEQREGARAAYLDTRAEALIQLGRLDEALADQRQAVELGEIEEVSELPEMKARLERIEKALGS